MKSADRRVGGFIKEYIATKDMVATLTGLALAGVAPFVVALWTGSSTVSRSSVEAATVFAGFVAAFGICRWKLRGLSLASEKSVAKLKKEYTEDIEEAKRTAAVLSHDFKVLRAEIAAAEKGGAEMLDSLQLISASVQQLGPHPDKYAALGVLGKATRLGSQALSTRMIGGGGVVLCAKRLILKGNVPWATRLAIWPSHEGDTEFPIAASRPLERLVTQRLPYYYVADADSQPNFPRHVQFAARTILVTPITISPGRAMGFLWVSSELPSAFASSAVYSYIQTLSNILAPLFVDEYANVDLPQSENRNPAQGSAE